MKNNIERYIVWIPGQEFPALYNEALGKDALSYAKQTASRFFGRIDVQYKDGSIKEKFRDYGGKD